MITYFQIFSIKTSAFLHFYPILLVHSNFSCLMNQSMYDSFTFFKEFHLRILLSFWRGILDHLIWFIFMFDLGLLLLLLMIVPFEDRFWICLAFWIIIRGFGLGGCLGWGFCLVTIAAVAEDDGCVTSTAAVAAEVSEVPVEVGLHERRQVPVVEREQEQVWSWEVDLSFP